MTLDDILHDIYTLEDELRAYERTYNLLSEIFYESYCNGEEPPDDAWMLDWEAWASAYELLLRFRKKYRAAITQLRTRDAQTIADLIARTARHEPIFIPA